MRYLISWPRTKVVLEQVALLIATLILIDIVCWFLLPNSIALRFVGYRAGLEDGGIGGNGGYPKDYFAAHPTRGFDIRAGALGVHRLVLEDKRYAVWSNRLGCFDQEWPQVPREYFYFAGDSFTWGYAPFEGTFPSLFQAKTGIPSLKCAVTHTGTLHQFEKFQEVLGTIGHAPRQVIVGYYANDPSNDYLHPHSAVVMGWLVDDTFLDGQNKPVRVDRPFIEASIGERLAATRSATYLGRGFEWLRGRLRHYSISTCVIYEAIHQGKAFAFGKVATPASGPDEGRLYNGQRIYGVYRLNSQLYPKGVLEYPNSSYTESNRRALDNWLRHAKENGYALTLVLIPPKQHHASAEFFSKLREYLATRGVGFIDLAQEFARLQVPREQLYWVRDGHFSPAGNRIVADILARRLRD